MNLAFDLLFEPLRFDLVGDVVDEVEKTLLQVALCKKRVGYLLF